MQSAAMYSKYCQAPAPRSTQQQQQQERLVQQSQKGSNSPGSKTLGQSNSASAQSFPGAQSDNSLGYQDSSNQSFVDVGSDHSFQSTSKDSSSHLHHHHRADMQIPSSSLLASSTANSVHAQLSTETAVPSSAVPTPSYRQAKVNPLVTTSTNFYVPANTLVQVSSGDDQWSSGYWRDNHRSVNVLESSLRTAAGGAKTGFLAAHGMLFVRLADVALNDASGHAMYLASNRHRPCYIAFSVDTLLHYNATELTKKHSRPSSPSDAQTATYEAVEVSALQQHFCAGH